MLKNDIINIIYDIVTKYEKIYDNKNLSFYASCWGIEIADEIIKNIKKKGVKKKRSIIMKLNKPKFFEDPRCDFCYDILKPFTLIFEINEGSLYTEWICLSCAKNQKIKLTKKREEKLLNKQIKLQIDYYLRELKKLKDLK